MSPKPQEIEAQLERERAELAATIDQLTYRLDPRVKATELVAAAKQLVHDAGSDPETTPEARDRARKILGGSAAAFVAMVTTAIVRRR